jgi:hypothetical protein
VDLITTAKPLEMEETKEHDKKESLKAEGRGRQIDQVHN